MRFGTFMVLAVAAAVGLLGAQPPAVDSDTFLSRARAALRLDPDLQSHFTYVEERRDVKVTKLGGLVIGPLRTFEVYPSPDPGRTYKRLIAVAGTPLSAADLAKRDAEHASDVERQARETPAQRRRRTAEEEEARRDREQMLNDAIAVFEAGAAGEETLDGERTRVFALTPRPSARVSTRQGAWMKHVEGRAWFADADQQLVRLDLHARDDIVIGWGIVGRIHQGSRLVIVRRKFEGAWLPSETRINASGRTLLFRAFDVNLVTKYWGYKRR
jgi:hypothetical protein